MVLHCSPSSSSEPVIRTEKLRCLAAGVQSLRTAQANIKRARDEVEEMLSHLDTARQVRMLPGRRPL